MKYTRLKLKMLLLVIGGSLVAMLLGLLLLRTVVDGVLQDPFAQIFVWAAQNVFGKSRTEATLLYQESIQDHRQDILTACMMLLMLVAFYLAMGKFTRWLNQVGQATRQVVSESHETVSLPRELAPVEADLRSIQAQLRVREEAVRVEEQRKQELIAFLAHDLKTPLTSVVGYLTLLSGEPNLDGEQREKYIGIALEKAQRLQELLSEFFDITRMDLKSATKAMVPIQLTVLLEQLTDEFYPLLAEKQLTCRTEIEPHLFVLGDPDKLARVFDNILRNAVSYSTPHGEVSIQACQTEARVEVTVINEGLEIPEKELARIFQKFYRLDAARSSRTGGAGLGLAIAKEIVELHNGTIRAECNGKSTRFIIALPQYAQEP